MKIINFENAYGIKKMLVENNKNLSNSCIYASNGVFKSSFSRALHNMSNDKNIEIFDRISNKKFVCEFTYNGITYNQDSMINNIIVYSKELYEDLNIQENQFLKQVLLLPKLQIELNDYLVILDNIFEEIKQNANYAYIKINDYKDLCEVFQVSGNGKIDYIVQFFEKIKLISRLNIDFIDFKKINQKAYDVIDSKEFKKEANAYIQIINRKINSKIFDNEFNDLNYLDLLDILGKTKFLNDNRKITICDLIFEDIESLSLYLENEVKKIKVDTEVSDQYKRLNKVIGNSKESNVIKELINDFSNIEKLSLGRSNLKLIKLKQFYEDEHIIEILNKLEKLKENIELLLNKSKNYKSEFEKAIDLYKKRFLPKFDIFILDQYETRLGIKLPKIYFSHKDDCENQLEETNLYKILSSGEKNALKILHLIVQIEAKKSMFPLIILDDIVETFDYANRNALVLYLREIKSYGCKLLLLTHNYDFYRFAIQKLELDELVAYIKNTRGSEKIIIKQNSKYQMSYSRIQNLNDVTSIIAIIPFVRELLMMTKGNSKNTEIDFFTGLLHFKSNTSEIYFYEVIEHIETQLKNIKIQYVPNRSEKYLDMLYTLKFDSKQIEVFDFEQKLVLSILLRIKLEQLILNNDFTILENCNKNQTEFLYEVIYNDLPSDIKDIFDKVLIITPEFIHYNSFMYEPLVDILPKELVDINDELTEQLNIKNLIHSAGL